MTYYIKITETLACSVGVEAPSEEAALNHVYRRWANGDYVLGGDDFKGVDVSLDEELNERPKAHRTGNHGRGQPGHER